MEFQSDSKNVLAKPESIENKPAEEGDPAFKVLVSAASGIWVSDMDPEK